MQHKHFAQREMCIHRHCMQQLLRESMVTLAGGQDSGQGLLAGDGNMIKKHAIVTNIDHPRPDVTNFCKQSAWIGIYITADQLPDLTKMHRLSKLVQHYCNASAACYLLLQSSQKGRVEARLFADAACTVAMPLALQEDGNLYQATVNC